MENKRSYICSFLIVLFHFVGLIGFLLPSLVPIFIKLVPWHLLLMFILLLISQQDKNLHFVFYLVTVFLLGFLLELAGVKTGIIFGNYAYGKTLGLKLFDVPLLIGLNWVMLVYAAATCVQALQMSENKIVKSAIAAFALVVLDYLIEPVAVKFDYWEWDTSAIPVKNYVCWYLISFLFCFVFYSFSFNKKNKAAITFFITQLLFFIALNLWAF
ncbi:carotenoid biosynthesis protein [Rubrolithibacter danxiaensis]|uniref:carotenoid biosynthesis protein n=1 Tax=Rubrolithibacter danxiaensis TaxID=3390805 RepID=UPI003BF88A25